MNTLHPGSHEVLLNIRGYPFNWFKRGDFIGKVNVLNLDLTPLESLPTGAPVVRAISGDARCLDFPDGK